MQQVLTSIRILCHVCKTQVTGSPSDAHFMNTYMGTGKGKCPRCGTFFAIGTAPETATVEAKAPEVSRETIRAIVKEEVEKAFDALVAEETEKTKKGKK